MICLSLIDFTCFFSKSLYILKLPSQNTFSSLENWQVDEAESCTNLWGRGSRVLSQRLFLLLFVPQIIFPTCLKGFKPDFGIKWP